jgi:hypothetical protein
LAEILKNASRFIKMRNEFLYKKDTFLSIFTDKKKEGNIEPESEDEKIRRYHEFHVLNCSIENKIVLKEIFKECCVKVS